MVPPYRCFVVIVCGVLVVGGMSVFLAMVDAMSVIAFGLESVKSPNGILPPM